MKRVFMKSGPVGPASINQMVWRVEFVFANDEAGTDYKGFGGAGRYAIRHNGKDNGHCPWTYRDAMSLVESGDWVEVFFDSELNEWKIGTLEEQAQQRRRRLSLPDVPQTQVEDGPW